MRPCPICQHENRTLIFSMRYKIPDGWTLPSQIDWYTCDVCGLMYGDGAFDQPMLDQYYRERYGYGLNSVQNVARLQADADMIAAAFPPTALILDFGGGGEDGQSVLVKHLREKGFRSVHCIGVGDVLPVGCDLIYASHVLEHVYDLPKTMARLGSALSNDGTLIIDGPDATGLLQKWHMPILDFNTKHIQHFTLRDYLNLGKWHNWELVNSRRYEMHGAPCFQLHFKHLDMARESARHVTQMISDRWFALSKIKEPVNVWGLGDVTWHLLSLFPLDVLDYIDNDPAYRGATYAGKPVQQRPTNDAPIVIMAQGQRRLLIENIRKAGVTNPIIEI